MGSELDELKARVAAGEASELDRTELLVRTVKAQAAAAVTNRDDDADEKLARALKLEHRLDAMRQVERLNALTRDTPTSEAWQSRDEGAGRGSRSSSSRAKATPGSGSSRRRSSSTG